MEHLRAIERVTAWGLKNRYVIDVQQYPRVAGVLPNQVPRSREGVFGVAGFGFAPRR